ncbi:DUF3144 domain-containing protein [Wenzhouxiangella sp. XN24]|uniref:DUF3144 domain-containing protein n=1 Tax=Wenzhouxiangella sp. XN24 TaxID=2713569 RepID=UPI0013EAB74E|nr:DUF3144 domain-containing protein [Wenzhouxiangella sp. XN24]NGX15050.1 DUF3144 domain-containing protein [Wenzhouxiangella sp. XN24]
MSNDKNGRDQVSGELKKIIESYSRLADHQGPAAVPEHGRIKFETEEAPPPDEQEKAAIDREFRQVVDRFIALANEQIDSVPREHVSMALLYAAARFNSFIVSTHAPSREKFRADRPAAFKFFTGEYHRMLGENLDDYERVYEGRADDKPADGK